VRLEQHRRRLGHRHPRCQSCGETALAALTGRHPDVVCYDCLAEQAGRAVVELDHFPGRYHGPATVPLGGNAHRVRTDEQRDWPAETLRNPHASPLRKAAATVRAWLDVMRVILDLAAWVPTRLEALDEQLTERDGERWWAELDAEGRAR